MENNFEFKGNEVVVENKGTQNLTQYAKPGIHEMMYNEMTFKTSPSGSPYMDCQGVNSKNEVISRQYYMNVTKGPSGKSAMDITSESLKKLSVALGREDMYNSTTASSQEEFVYKMSAIFSGKWFRTKVKGKEIRKNDGNTFIKGEISDAFESVDVPASESRLRFDETKDIKYLEGNAKQAQKTKTAVESTDDLPF